MKISIIIPTYNEAKHVGRLIEYLRKQDMGCVDDIIVSDGGSNDDTMMIAAHAKAHTVISPSNGRAPQLNYGASFAQGDVLSFVHADTIPPKTYAQDIILAVTGGYDLGRFLSEYQSDSWLLKINSFLSRIDTFEGMGADQTLFIKRSLFQENGGFNTSIKIMEEFEFCSRARHNKNYKIIQKPVLISARKYKTNSWLKVQKANYIAMKMFKAGASQDSIAKRYREMLNPYLGLFCILIDLLSRLRHSM